MLNAQGSSGLLNWLVPSPGGMTVTILLVVAMAREHTLRTNASLQPRSGNDSGMFRPLSLPDHPVVFGFNPVVSELPESTRVETGAEVTGERDCESTTSVESRLLP